MNNLTKVLEDTALSKKPPNESHPELDGKSLKTSSTRSVKPKAKKGHEKATDSLPDFNSSIKTEEKNYLVKSLAKGLSILRAFENEGSMNISELSLKTGQDRASARRFALTLVDLGYLSLVGKRLSLTPKVLELGFSYFQSNSWIDIAIPEMRKLTASLEETCTLAVRSGDHIVFVARTPAGRFMSFSVDVGTQLPIESTAVGRVLLSALDDPHLTKQIDRLSPKKYCQKTITSKDELTSIVRDTHKKGYCVVNGELEDDLVSVAVPVRNASGQVIAGLNVCSHSKRALPDNIDGKYLEELKKTRDAIEFVFKRVKLTNAL